MLWNVADPGVLRHLEVPAFEEKSQRTEPDRQALAEREGSETHARMITVCQCNIYDGGRWSGLKRKEVTYQTARRFARFVRSTNRPGSKYPPIAVIGMQELSETDSEKMESFLREETGVDWQSAHTSQGVRDKSGIGIFWRTDLVEPAVGGDLGDVVVGELDNGYVIKFAGRVFRTPSGERLALFTGKLAWEDAVVAGKRITGEERRMQARRLRSWIREKLGEPPDVAVVTTDLNARPNSPAWREMNTEYTDPSRQHTHNSLAGRFALNVFGKRLDYIWLQRTRRAGFVDGPHRSPPFGSDHRAVYATIQFYEGE